MGAGGFQKGCKMPGRKLPRCPTCERSAYKPPAVECWRCRRVSAIRTGKPVGSLPGGCRQRGLASDDDLEALSRLALCGLPLFARRPRGC